MAARSRCWTTSKFHNFKALSRRSSYSNSAYMNVRNLQFSRTLSSSGPLFSTSTNGQFQKTTKDEPVAFSISKARHHTVDESLGISKPKNSNFPLFLGLGLFSILIYLSFVRNEPETNTETLEELLEKLRIMHEENQSGPQQVTDELENTCKD